MSRLRAICPDCRAHTAVALEGGYECHSCGRSFGGGLVRVPRAWGVGGDAMAEAARLPLPYPEAATVDEPTLAGQSLALARELPERPIVLGGCCCAHIGAVEGLAARHGRIAVLWFDAHGDLNTIESSPSGNEWATPLRRLIDSGAVGAEDVALVGARNLDPPEEEFIERHAVGVGGEAVAGAVDGTDGAYVALDFDVLDPAEAASFMPEPDGLSVAEVEAVLQDAGDRRAILGAGFTAFLPDERNLPVLARLSAAVGF
ncbi:MAG TPA: arginase family protein [Gaiellaceae bacterium]|nr:arginase family protein [Gaiellaceae bacterium]